MCRWHCAGVCVWLNEPKKSTTESIDRLRDTHIFNVRLFYWSFLLRSHKFWVFFSVSFWFALAIASVSSVCRCSAHCGRIFFVYVQIQLSIVWLHYIGWWYQLWTLSLVDCCVCCMCFGQRTQCTVQCAHRSRTNRKHSWTNKQTDTHGHTQRQFKWLKMCFGVGESVRDGFWLFRCQQCFRFVAVLCLMQHRIVPPSVGSGRARRDEQCVFDCFRSTPGVQPICSRQQFQHNIVELSA